MSSAEPSSLVSLLGLAVTFGLALGLFTFALQRRLRGERLPKLFRGLAASYVLWLGLGFAQALAPGATPLLVAGYLILPLALALTWGFVVLNLGESVHAILVTSPYRWVALGGTLYDIGFSLYATRLVGPPDTGFGGAPAMPAHGFVVVAMAYGPLAIWPILEFWIPALDLFGAISLGTGLLVVTLAALVGVGLAFMACAMRRRLAYARAAASLGGSAALLLGLSFCCCCPPVVAPLLAMVLGSAAVSPATGLFLGSSSPLYTLIQVAALTLGVVGVLGAGAHLERLGQPGCCSVIRR